ncbi:DUF3667 domain-containing protein [Aquimarina sp. 2304DJ70-9]|uniref:DUF3667 domain-containing protein n=1 Tax=Aquimarina penaris TaxID=3231044 RepID=UPI0034624E58
MNCKNCKKNLPTKTKFCDECGAKVIEKRITFKNMVSDLFINALGWDNRYFVTIRNLIGAPHILFKEYINGTRKKYVNPFGFFAIGAAISLLVFNQFSEDYLSLTREINKKQMEAMNDVIQPDTKNDESLSDSVKVVDQNELLKEQLERGGKIQKAILKYYNLFSFMLLPFYTIIAYLTFWKPYNYGEHLIINAYIQGVTFLSTTIFFLLSLVTTPSVFSLGILTVVGYYTYAYSRFYNLSVGKALLKVLRFFAILLLMFIVLMILSVIIGIIIGLFK